MNCLVVEGRMVLSPVFLGAEPNEIDRGPHAGQPSLTERIDLGIGIDGRTPGRPTPGRHRVRADGRPGDAARSGASRR